MCILSVDARYPGSNHDSFIWEHSTTNQKMQREFEEGKRNTWILGNIFYYVTENMNYRLFCVLFQLGDGGYKLMPHLMTPFRNPSNNHERRYNQKHISTRNVVERCFGVLKNRWRCILGSRGLHYTPDKCTQIINACCALHNMCIRLNCINDLAIFPDEEVDDSIISVSDGIVNSRAVAIRNNIAINL